MPLKKPFHKKEFEIRKGWDTILYTVGPNHDLKLTSYRIQFFYRTFNSCNFSKFLFPRFSLSKTRSHLEWFWRQLIPWLYSIRLVPVLAEVTIPVLVPFIYLTVCYEFAILCRIVKYNYIYTISFDMFTNEGNASRNSISRSQSSHLAYYLFLVRNSVFHLSL
jgi:hypothetical protein